MRTVIIEDELPQAHRLRSLLEEMKDPPEITGMVQSVGEAVDFLSHQQVDLVFMDIHLADGLCFDIFRKVTITVPVIFTTAFDKYAIEAFRHNGIDYLLKPVSGQDLEKSLQKFRTFTAPANDYTRMLESIRLAASAFHSYRNRFICRLGKKLRIVNASDVAYFYMMGGGVFIRTQKNENYLIDTKMESLEQETDPYLFFRLNRQVMASVTSIREMIPYSKSRIKVILMPPFEEDVIISYKNVKEFMRWAKK